MSQLLTIIAFLKDKSVRHDTAPPQSTFQNVASSSQRQSSKLAFQQKREQESSRRFYSPGHKFQIRDHCYRSWMPFTDHLTGKSPVLVRALYIWQGKTRLRITSLIMDAFIRNAWAQKETRKYTADTTFLGCEKQRGHIFLMPTPRCEKQKLVCYLCDWCLPDTSSIFDKSVTLNTTQIDYCTKEPYYLP
jgi:hypothetical protein